MPKRALSLLLLAQCTARAPDLIPATPLGRFASEWLSLTAKPDSLAIAHFTRAHQGSLPFSPAELDSTVADLQGFTGALGPLTPVTTLSSTDSVLVLLVRTRAAGSWRALFRQAAQPNHEQVIVEVSPTQETPALAFGVVELPMTRTPSGRPIVMVSVNGSAPLRFVIDIGTNVSIVTPGALQKLLSPDLATRAIDAGRFVFDSLALGGARYRSGALRIDDLGTELDGLLGLDMFADLLLTLDYPASRVRMSKDSLPPPDGREVLAYTLPRPGSPTIPFTLDGRTYEGVLDVGSISALSVPVSMMATLRWQKPPVPGKRHSGPQLEDARSTVGRSKGDAVIAGLTVRQPIIEGMEPVGGEILIGQPMLAGVALSLDQIHRRVRLTPVGVAEIHPGPFEVSGFRLAPTGTGEVVDDVIPATGAAAAGMQIGDTVSAINGQTMSGINQYQLHALLDSASAYTVDLVRRGAARRLKFPKTRLVN